VGLDVEHQRPHPIARFDPKTVQGMCQTVGSCANFGEGGGGGAITVEGDYLCVAEDGRAVFQDRSQRQVDIAHGRGKEVWCVHPAMLAADLGSEANLVCHSLHL
jgi:hypothetical protein